MIQNLKSRIAVLKSNWNSYNNRLSLATAENKLHLADYLETEMNIINARIEENEKAIELIKKIDKNNYHNLFTDEKY